VKTHFDETHPNPFPSKPIGTPSAATPDLSPSTSTSSPAPSSSSSMPPEPKPPRINPLEHTPTPNGLPLRPSHADEKSASIVYRMVEVVCKSAGLGDDAIELGVLHSALAVLLILPSWLLSSTHHHKPSKQKTEPCRERERASLERGKWKWV
jgi:hypothetical protein